MRQKIMSGLASLALIFSWLVKVSPVAAETSWIGSVSCIGIGCSASSAGDVNTASVKLINQVLMFLTAVAAIWFLITIVWSGIKIIQSAKSPEDFNTHMKRIMWAAIGLIVVALAFTISSAVVGVLFPDPIYDNPVNVLVGN
jgi:hypothetical protein